MVLAMLGGTTEVTFAQTTPPNSNTNIVPDNLPGTSQSNSLIKCGNKPGVGAQGSSEACDFNDFIELVQNILKLVFAFSAFVATGMFMYAGFLMITAMGDVGQITKAKAVFRRVVIGFLIMFMAFILVQQTLSYLKLNQAAQDIIGRFIKLSK